MKRTQLIVEGSGDIGFFNALLEHLSLHHVVDVRSSDGKTKLGGALSTLVKEFAFPETVRSIGIVQDADGSPDDTLRDIQTDLASLGLPVPTKPNERVGPDLAVMVLILPGEDRTGMIETLLCDTFTDGDEECITTFLQCAGAPFGVNRDKARAQAYLATKPEPHGSIGVAASNGYWNFDHDALAPVRNFLRDLCEAE